MNENKVAMEVAALDSDKIREGDTSPEISEAQLVALMLFRLKGIAPKEINCRTVIIKESADTIDDIRKSLANMGLKEVLRAGLT